MSGDGDSLRGTDGILRTEDEHREVLLDICRAVQNGWIDDEECARRLDLIGATDDELLELI